VKLPTPVLRVVGKCLRTWWKIRKPATSGVKVLLIHPGDPAQCLIVRHSHADSAWWGMPGGAYRPGRETPEQAGVREVSEELALTVTEVPTVLDTVSTRPSLPLGCRWPKRGDERLTVVRLALGGTGKPRGQAARAGDRVDRAALPLDREPGPPRRYDRRHEP
jgi:8-oxo-dGTP pyrophosphatase MutT (NUDIX family)